MVPAELLSWGNSRVTRELLAEKGGLDVHLTQERRGWIFLAPFEHRRGLWAINWREQFARSKKLFCRNCLWQRHRNMTAALRKKAQEVLLLSIPYLISQSNYVWYIMVHFGLHAFPAFLSLVQLPAKFFWDFISRVNVYSRGGPCALLNAARMWDLSCHWMADLRESEWGVGKVLVLGQG